MGCHLLSKIIASYLQRFTDVSQLQPMIVDRALKRTCQKQLLMESLQSCHIFAIITRLLYSRVEISMYHLRNLFHCQTKIHGLESRRPIGLQQGMVVYLPPGPAVVKIVSSNCHRPFRHLLTFDKHRFLSQRWHITSSCAGHLATCFFIAKYATYEYDYRNPDCIVP